MAAPATSTRISSPETIGLRFVRRDFHTPTPNIATADSPTDTQRPVRTGKKKYGASGTSADTKNEPARMSAPCVGEPPWSIATPSSFSTIVRSRTLGSRPISAAIRRDASSGRPSRSNM